MLNNHTLAQVVHATLTHTIVGGGASENDQRTDRRQTGKKVSPNDRRKETRTM